jgi:hypothetical protein
MMTRRGLLQGGVLAMLPSMSALAFAAGARRAARPLPPISLYTLVYDERFLSSVSFGHEANRAGQPTYAIAGDVTQLWFNHLYDRWSRGPAAIGGLTTTDAFFCLEQFGNDAGLRRVLAIRHRMVEGRTEHYLRGSRMALDAATLACRERDWGAAMARVLLNCPATRAELAATTIDGHTRGTDNELRIPLVSWLIAPRTLHDTATRAVGL